MIGTLKVTDGLKVTSAAISDRGLSEKRPHNEDSYLEMRQCGIFAVADGVGGAQAGEVASQMAVEILGEAFANMPPASDAENIMRAAFERANSAIFQMAQELPSLSNMATTIAALHLNGNIATIGHLGDSRVYRLDRHGNLMRETDDHSVVAEEVRAGRMTEEQANNHPGRNVISRALGAESTVDPDLKTTLVEPGTTFLLCTDGITRHVTDEEIKGLLGFNGSPEDVCQFLKKLCYERGAEDNLTAIIVRVGDTVIDNDASLLQLDDAETTIASARPAVAQVSSEDTILELDQDGVSTAEFPKVPMEREPKDSRDVPSSQFMTENVEPAPESESQEAETLKIEPQYQVDESLPYQQTISDYQTSEEVHSVNADESVQVGEITTQQSQSDNFSMFGASEIADQQEKSVTFSKLIPMFGILLLGGLIGVGVYHFLFAPSANDTTGSQLTEMRSANIPLSAFEENRRNVDKDPSGYIVKFGATPQDCEDYFLLGRAFMLTGDFVKSKAAFVEARNRLGEADPVNAKTLANEIAVSLTVLNDTTVQTMLKKELDAGNKPTNANSNVNR